MTQKEQADRLRTIADIIEGDLPFQVQRPGSDLWIAPVNSPRWYADMHTSFPGIRIRRKPVKVPLDANDIPIGSVLRHKSASENLWMLVTAVNGEFVGARDARIAWDTLADNYLIKRPPYTDEWQECTKLVEGPEIE